MMREKNAIMIANRLRGRASTTELNILTDVGDRQNSTGSCAVSQASIRCYSATRTQRATTDGTTIVSDAVQPLAPHAAVALAPPLTPALPTAASRHAVGVNSSRCDCKYAAPFSCTAQGCKKYERQSHTCLNPEVRFQDQAYCL